MTRIMLILIVLTLTGCSPAVNPISPAYPCGTRMHQCSSGGCCWNNEDCGGDTPGCRPGMCCYAGSGTLGAKPEEREQTPVEAP